MIVTKAVEYEAPGGTFAGTISHDESVAGPRPGVLVAHAYGGQSAFDTAAAEELARCGYVGFALDMYGKGVRAADADEASALMRPLVADRALLSARINAAHAALQADANVDADRTAAIGYCFGGRCVLDLARSGAPVRGVVSFHGIYDAPDASRDVISAAVLVLHGWDDPLAPPAAVIELAEEMSQREADWQLLAFGHTAHAFTNPQAASPQTGAVFQPRSADRAWAAAVAFLAERFAD